MDYAYTINFYDTFKLSKNPEDHLNEWFSLFNHGCVHADFKPHAKKMVTEVQHRILWMQSLGHSVDMAGEFESCRKELLGAALARWMEYEPDAMYHKAELAHRNLRIGLPCNSIPAIKRTEFIRRCNDEPNLFDVMFDPATYGPKNESSK